MSVAAPAIKHHHQPNEDHLRELRRLEQTPWFQAGLRIGFTVVYDDDIPYVGGVSTDGRHIFIDAHFPEKVRVKPYGMIDIRPGLIQHERIEGILLRNGYRYHAAHDFATAAENRVYRVHGWDPAKIQAVYPHFERTDEKEKLTRVPSNIDLRPYLAPPVDEALLKRMRAAMFGVPAGKTILELAGAH